MLVYFAFLSEWDIPIGVAVHTTSLRTYVLSVVGHSWRHIHALNFMIIAAHAYFGGNMSTSGELKFFSFTAASNPVLQSLLSLFLQTSLNSIFKQL